ncbi:MAG: LytTR family DNA-binding domain-containing protein [Leeuwenhoekiella sp.]
MTKVLLIDDELNCLKIFNGYFSKLSNYEVVGSATCYDEAVKLTMAEEPDLVFLDINLGSKSGFEYLEQFKDSGFWVVVTTAHLEHSIRAFKLSALDFLLKPFTKAQFDEVIEKFEADSERLHSKRIEVFLNNLRNPSKMKINVTVKEGTLFIDVRDVVRCQASGSYTEIYTDLKKKYLVSNPLKFYHDQLEPSGFFRVHRSHLINLHKCNKYLNSGFAVMSDGSKVEVSTRKKNGFMRCLENL